MAEEQDAEVEEEISGTINSANTEKESVETADAPAQAKPKNKRKRSNDDIGTALIPLEENKIRLLVLMKMSCHEPIDEDVSFFNSLLPHVRTLLPRDKLLLRIKMQELVYNFICKTPTYPETHLRLQDYQIVSGPSSTASYFSNYSDELSQNI